jgi:hypothetical protein
MDPFERRSKSWAVSRANLRIIGLMQLLASSLLCYGLTHFAGHPYFFMGALIFSVVFVVIGASNLADGC